MRSGAAVGLAVLALAVYALARASSQASLPRADFAFCNQNEIASLDPHVASDVSSGRILGALYEGLTRIDPSTGAPAPALAESWSVAPDGLGWTFRIRAEARWSNGEPLLARHVLDGWLRLLHPDTAARNAELLWVLVGAREYTATPPGERPDASRVGLRATGPHELELRLLRPVPYLASLLAYWPLVPVHTDSIARHGHDWLRPEHLVVNGPFVVVEHRLRDRIRLQRNPHYWNRDAVALATVDAYAASGATTQLNMYLTGLVDWIVKPPPALYDSLRERDDWRASGQLGMSFLRFNTTRPPFDDPRVRAALALALDREALTRDVLGGGQRPARSFVPPGLGEYTPAPFPPGDPERARALLAEAGYPGGRGLRPFELLSPHTEATRDLCAAMAARWRDVLGIAEVHLTSQEFGTYIDSCQRLVYDTAWGVWIGDYLDPSTFLDIFASTSGNNRTGWGDPRYDALLARAAGERDEARRLELLHEAETLLLQALPMAPLYQRASIHLVSPRVRGFGESLLDVHPLQDLSLAGDAPP